ncbi:oxidoreductase [Sphingopyxis panaciterrae]
MFKPAERIPFRASAGTLPTAAEAEQSRLFSSVAVGRVRLAHRSWVPAMVPWRASDDGFVNADVIDWYARFAAGCPGAIVVEATGIRDVPSGPLLRIGDDRFVPGLRDLADAVREASGGQTRLFIQLIDFLAIKRRPARATFLARFLELGDVHREAAGTDDDAAVRAALAAMPDAQLREILSARDWESMTQGFRERVTDVERPHVAALPQVLPGLFADAAARAQRAGFDGAELHYAHAYTMASFLSATNDRSDGYGGKIADRVRLPIEVLAAVRARVGPDFAVGARYLAEECIPGGNGLSEGMAIGIRLAEAGADFLSLSRGGKFDDAAQPRVGEAAYPYTGPSGYECMPQFLSDTKGPFGRNSEAAKAIRRAIRDSGHATPLVVAGGVHNFEMAEAMLHDGTADIVAAARQSLADPDWLLKIRRGYANEVRLCEYSNYCEGLDQKHKQVTCKLWDREAVPAPGRGCSHDAKRRLIAPPWPQTRN